MMLAHRLSRCDVGVTMSDDRVFSTGSKRDSDSGKPPFSKLPWAALAQVALVHKYGDAHYGMGNWRKGQPFSAISDSMLRHWEAWWNGEDFDKKSGLHHLAHCSWNVLILLWQVIFYKPELDDRMNPDGSWHSPEFATSGTAKALERGRQE